MNMTKTNDESLSSSYVPAATFSSEFQYNKHSKMMDTIKIAPIYKNMFSEFMNYPNQSKHRIYKDKFENIIPKKDPEFMDNNEINHLRYHKSGCKPKYHSNSPQPTGKDRWLFITNTTNHNSNSVIPNIQYVNKLMKDAYYTQILVKAPKKNQSVSTQTMYRDSSSQTLPYTPDFLLRPGANPEILSLIPLSFKVGLPAGLHEVLAFERARERRKSEEKWKAEQKDESAQSNTKTNLHLMRKRLVSLTKKEFMEWKIRDQELNEIQYARLKVIAQLLNEKKLYFEQMHESFLQRVTLEETKAKQKELVKNRCKHSKSVRVILKRRLGLKQTGSKTSIIEQYANCNSQVWAPLARIGQFLDQGSERYLLDNKYLSSFDGLEELESFIPDYSMFPKFNIPSLQIYTKNGFKKKKYRLEDDLTKLYEKLKQNRLKPHHSKKQFNLEISFLQKNTQMSTQESTPCIELDDEQLTNVDVIMSFLQRLIRGRACQIAMYEGKEKRIDLIRELRSTHAVSEAEMKRKIEEKHVTHYLQQMEMNEYEKLHNWKELINAAYGESLADISDFLCKELVRLKEERRLHAFMVRAFRDRQIREAEESGLRQIEERRRREEDEMFKQIIKTHQITVDQYLDTLIKDNIESTGSDLSQKQVEKLEEAIHEETYAKEKNMDYLATEEIVSDLVHHFLIPEVYKNQHRENIALKQRKYLLSAHREIVKTTDQIMDHKTTNNSADEELTDDL